MERECLQSRRLVRLRVGCGRLVRLRAPPAEARASEPEWAGAKKLSAAEYVFIAVGTPMSNDGSAAEMQYVYQAADAIARELTAPAIIVNKSTSPIGTGDSIRRVLEENNPDFSHWIVVSNPEFLREGNAVDDCLKPARIVLGSHEPEHCKQVAELYETFDCPIHLHRPGHRRDDQVRLECILATKISFINELARLCDALVANVTDVADGMGLDESIGRQFLNAGLGYGGSCFRPIRPSRIAVRRSPWTGGRRRA